MTRVILNESLRKQLKDLAQPLELCDESGKVMAVVFPQVDLSDYAQTEPAITEEELRRREQSDEWYTTQNVLARLKDPRN